MFFLLKLILIVLTSQTYEYVTQDSEIILLPAWEPTGAIEIPLTLKVFGKFIQLNLHRNDEVVSSALKVEENYAKDVAEKLWKLKASDICIYFHEGHVSSAAINFCQEHGLWEGIILVEDDILEIRPLQNVFVPLSFIDNVCIKDQINQTFGKPHLIRRLLQYYNDSNFHHINNFKRKQRHVVQEKEQEKFTIKLAVFVDVEAYRKFKAILNDDTKITDMMHEYVSFIQTFFYLPSLGIPIDISLVHLHIWRQQPSGLPVSDGDIAELLPSFCEYVKTLNPPHDDDPNHWDIGLYITAMNLFKYKWIAVKRASVLTKSYEIFGESYYDLACSPHNSCVIVQFLPFEVESSGLRSSLNAVHLIGRLLGLEYDSEHETGYFLERSDDVSIMSRVRPYRGNITWSPKSREKIKIQLKEKSCFHDNTRRN
nr:PREDICTED: uncharacterized protein LOC105667393 [Linepithema humile]